jgi:hypothetical protein
MASRQVSIRKDQEVKKPPTLDGREIAFADLSASEQESLRQLARMIVRTLFKHNRPAPTL